MGAGLAALGVAGEVTEQQGRPHLDDTELSAFVAQQSRPVSTAVAGFDVTFSPVKSVSTLWAIAPKDLSEKIAAAHDRAVASTLDYLQKEGGYTRLGARGVAQVRTRGLIMAAFSHRDSRAGDPDLHTHVAISNKVQTEDGRWLALDARMLYRLNAAGSERYNTQLEVELSALGLQFAERSSEPGKRPIREIIGVDPALNEHFSSRRSAIESHRDGLVKQFRAVNGRVPNSVEMIALSQQANLATRQAKHEPQTFTEQREQWHTEAVATLGGESGLKTMFANVALGLPPKPVLAPGATPTKQQERDLAEWERYKANKYKFTHPTDAALTVKLVNELAQTTIERISRDRSLWRETNLMAEAERQARYAGVAPEQIRSLAENIVTRTLSPELSLPVGAATEIDEATPHALQRADGQSQFTVAKAQLFTSTEILDAEARVIAAAGTADLAALDATDVDLALLEWSANNGGRQLNTGQQLMVTDVATSGLRVQLVLAPAGSGKTTAMGVLASAWMARGWSVTGLAPQASAAQELSAAMPGVESDTVDKLVHDIELAEATKTAVPAQWDTITAGSLVIIDEAGLASTRNLDATIRFVNGRGGRVLLVGDEAQRAASGAGGVLRDIDITHGSLTLTEVMRFKDPIQGEASLALRAGDVSGLGYYLDRGQIHAVTPGDAVDTIYNGWAADIAGGADSIMIGPNLATVAGLNARARADRIAATGRLPGRELTLPNGEVVSAGDTILTKRNKRQLTLGAGDFIRNNYRWTVDEVYKDGSLRATDIHRGRTRTIPAWYVADGHVRLGYAYTYQSVQGVTVGGRDRVGTTHGLFDSSMTRNDAYPALTRATDRNNAYVLVGIEGDTHDIITPESVSPAIAVENLSAIFRADGSSRSATTQIRDSHDPVLLLGQAGNAYAHAIVAGAEQLIGPEKIQQITEQAEAEVPGITTAPDTLRGHLVVLAADGQDPIGRLAAAARGRELDTAVDLAAVLDYRLDPSGNHSQGAGPLPWLPSIPQVLVDIPEWGTYLTKRAARVTDLADQINQATDHWTYENAPTWAVPYLDNPKLVADLAVWRAFQETPEADLRPAGERPSRLTQRKHHAVFTDRAISVGGDPTDGADRWAAVLAQHGVHGAEEDDFWPVLAVATGPLNAERAASSLRWRLADQLGSLAAAPTSATHRLRPAWTNDLETVIGVEDAARIQADHRRPRRYRDPGRCARRRSHPGRRRDARRDATHRPTRRAGHRVHLAAPHHHQPRPRHRARRLPRPGTGPPRRPDRPGLGRPLRPVHPSPRGRTHPRVGRDRTAVRARPTRGRTPARSR